MHDPVSTLFIKVIIPVTIIRDMVHAFHSGILAGMPIMAIETGIVMEDVLNAGETGLTDAMVIMETTGNVIVQHHDATETADAGD
jgi:hypothetical protein